MKTRMLYTLLSFLFPATLFAVSADTDQNKSFHENFNLKTDRHFISPQVWSNPMEAWKLKNQRLETIIPHNNLNLQLLSHSIIEGEGGFSTSADFGVIKG